MTAAPGQDFYTVLVEGRADGENFVQVFFAWAEDVGEAIYKILLAAREREGIEDPVASELDYYDFEGLGTGEDSVDELADLGVFVGRTRYFFPASPRFKVPDGVILSCTDGEDVHSDDLADGYVKEERDDGLLELTVTVDEARLLPVFMELAAALPTVVVSWVTLGGRWEDSGLVAMYANESLTESSDIEQFLSDNRDDILRNGFVKFTVYDEEGETNLALTDHKEINLLTYSDEILERVVAALGRLGLEEKHNMPQVGRNFYHWHYRPLGCKDRARLIDSLMSQGFAFWQEYPDPACEEDDEDEETVH